jgi:hypothetical protein
MAYQFIHYNTYGLEARSKKAANGKTQKGDKATASGVIDEAMRTPSHSEHVKNPKPPKILFGMDPRQMLLELKADAAIAKDRTGKRKLPKGAQILVAGVASMPLKTVELLADFESYKKTGVKGECLTAYDKWKKLLLPYLNETYGDSLQSVILHFDEAQIHAHFYCRNELKNGTLNLDNLDIATDAERALNLPRESRGKGKASERFTARIEALKKYQDDYFEAVGKRMGWSRKGPKVRRLTHQEYTAEKKKNAELASALDAVEKMKPKLDYSRQYNKELSDRLLMLQSQFAALQAMPEGEEKQNKLTAVMQQMKKLQPSLRN